MPANLINATTAAKTTNTRLLLEDAVHQHKPWSPNGLLERSFTLAFSQLVYAQIWEDPVIDMDALQITPKSNVLTIASGGCNVASYLTANPASITAVDLNATHVAMTKLKLAALTHIQNYETFRTMFSGAPEQENVKTYKHLVRPYLDDKTRAYWDGRDITGRQRITRFERNIYSYGLLGKFITIAHLLGRLYGIDPKALLDAETHNEQIQIYENQIAPLFERRMIKWLLDRKWSLFGLGIPPAQYDKLLGGRRMSEIVEERLRKLACQFDFNDNYFAHQAFGRRYGDAPSASLPPYLQQQNFQHIKRRTHNVTVLQTSFTKLLTRQPSRSMDCFVLLDAQDWMDDAELTELWTELTRVARDGARVIFRTADSPSLLPGRVPDHILDRWEYQDIRSADFTRRDRSAIYGGFHLYELL